MLMMVFKEDFPKRTRSDLGNRPYMIVYFTEGIMNPTLGYHNYLREKFDVICEKYGFHAYNDQKDIMVAEVVEGVYVGSTAIRVNLTREDYLTLRENAEELFRAM